MLVGCNNTRARGIEGTINSPACFVPRGVDSDLLGDVESIGHGQYGSGKREDETENDSAGRKASGDHVCGQGAREK